MTLFSNRMGPPSHTSNPAQTHLEQVVPHFIQKDEWPPQSPDLNPMDYTILDSLSEKVYKGRTQKFTENELKENILEKWEEITLEEVRKSMGSFKKRLREIGR